ncbi:hypothetical protein R2F25_38300 [Streptomyces sp. UP1A-1]|nr:hypothetical protein [Streptomyces sp. UP1A-1]
MATNTTPKKAPARADEPTEAETVTAEARPKHTPTTIVPAVVGPAPLVRRRPGQGPALPPPGHRRPRLPARY